MYTREQYYDQFCRLMNRLNYIPEECIGETGRNYFTVHRCFYYVGIHPFR